MNKQGISGGFIAYQNILNIKNIPSSLVKMASKEGLQSLYTDPDSLLEKYKDTPVLNEIKSRSGEDLLWVKARAIDADVVNANGDYFSKDELIREIDVKDKKIPVYKTFEGCPIYTNHKNDDIEQAKGMVVYAEWDEENNCVWCTFFIDTKCYPDIARGIRLGYLHDVSMGCFVPDTKVLTTNGSKNIQDVKLQDTLIGKDGKPTEIINIQIQNKKEDIYVIKTIFGTIIKATKEHPFYVTEIGNSLFKPKFIKAQDLTTNHMLVSPPSQKDVLYKNIETRISNIDREYYEGKVYNFETEDHTYVVENFVVHNCEVEYGVCSKCGNKAHNESQYCKCLKENKGRKDKKVYEKNFGCKFIELSIVGDGAFEKCEVASIFDTEDILNKMVNLEKVAQRIHNMAVLAGGQLVVGKDVARDSERTIRSVVSTTNNILKYAQSAGTLVGGALMAQEGAGSNATISTILTALGLNPNSGLNVLDLLNLSLNLLEVGIMNLFSRKDTIDLAHVGKITKAMADLQSTMQDMIDDGIDTGPQTGGTPLNQQQLGATQQTNIPEQSYQNNQEGVGRQMSPQQVQQQVQNTMPFSLGGGIKSASIIWDDENILED